MGLYDLKSDAYPSAYLEAYPGIGSRSVQNRLMQNSLVMIPRSELIQYPTEKASFWVYVRLFRDHWRILVLGLTFALAVLFLDWVEEKRLKFEIIGVIFAGFIVWAGFKTWRDERRLKWAIPIESLIDLCELLLSDLERFSEAVRTNKEKFAVEHMTPGLEAWEAGIERSEMQRRAVVFRHHYLDYIQALGKTPVITSATMEAMRAPDFKRSLDADLSTLRQERTRVLGKEDRD